MYCAPKSVVNCWYEVGSVSEIYLGTHDFRQKVILHVLHEDKLDKKVHQQPSFGQTPQKS